MKSKFLFTLILSAGLLLINFSDNQVNSQTPYMQPAKQKTIKYTCPMHPEIIQNHPGNCPKCGMKLVEKKDVPAKDVLHSNDTSKIKHLHKKMMHDSTIIN
jgi:hypothetical protein